MITLIKILENQKKNNKNDKIEIKIKNLKFYQ